MSAPVALIGPMGSGKSSIGRKLAKRLGRSFVDTDRRIAAAHGPIPALFTERGEDAFRSLEAAVVADALQPGAVVALGGGAVLDAGTQALLERCDVVLLAVRPGVVAKRLGDGRGRPLIAEGGMEAWQRIHDERAPLYARLADVTIDTSTGPISAVVERVADWLEAR